MRALRAATPVMEPGAICWADYRLTFRDDAPVAEEAFDRLLAAEYLMVTKKTKKGDQQIDLKKDDCVAYRQKAGEMVLSVRLPAGGTVNWSPMLVTGAYNELLSREPYWTGLERTAILTEDFSDFC